MDGSGNDTPCVGLVLSGGGARGAYEVGVLRYVFERLPRPARFQVVTGSSVGAINGAYVAATCDRPRAIGRTLARVWQELRVDDVYRFGWSQMRNLPQVLFGKTASPGQRQGGLVDPSFLETIVRNRIPWQGIAENLARGTIRAFSVSATELATGLTTVFVHTADGTLPTHWPLEHGQNVVATSIGAVHCLASAAIPLVFPAVRVGEHLFVDGSLRQNTPIRPAMRLGANRLLVVSLRHEKTSTHFHRAREDTKEIYPNAPFMLGKMFNALMLDKLETDLARIRRTNELVEAGTKVYGPDFAAKIAEAMPTRTTSYTPVEVVKICPSDDLGRLAYDVVKRTELRQYDGMMARWIRRAVLGNEDIQESDLASYVLFDPEYIARLIDLGYQDAAAQHARILSLFE